MDVYGGNVLLGCSVYVYKLEVMIGCDEVLLVEIMFELGGNDVMLGMMVYWYSYCVVLLCVDICLCYELCCILFGNCVFYVYKFFWCVL